MGGVRSSKINGVPVDSAIGVHRDINQWGPRAFAKSTGINYFIFHKPETWEYELFISVDLQRHEVYKERPFRFEAE